MFECCKDGGDAIEKLWLDKTTGFGHNCIVWTLEFSFPASLVLKGVRCRRGRDRGRGRGHGDSHMLSISGTCPLSW